LSTLGWWILVAVLHDGSGLISVLGILIFNSRLCREAWVATMLASIVIASLMFAFYCDEANANEPESIR
jgi:hypothetical protein